MVQQKDALLTKLDELEARFDELEKQIAEPAVAADSTKLIALSKEHGQLIATVTKFR